MSAVKLTLIICDGGCGEVYASGDMKTLPASAQRGGYKSDGWVYMGGRDYCGECKGVIDD